MGGGIAFAAALGFDYFNSVVGWKFCFSANQSVSKVTSSILVTFSASAKLVCSLFTP